MENFALSAGLLLAALFFVASLIRRGRPTKPEEDEDKRSFLARGLYSSHPGQLYSKDLTERGNLFGPHPGHIYQEPTWEDSAPEQKPGKQAG